MIRVTDVERLEADVWAGIEECKKLGYNPTLFIRMVKEHGALEATRRVVDRPGVTDGFVKLAWDMQPRRPDLTSEQLVLNYPALFDEGVVQKARARLGTGSKDGQTT